jgi:hypothetical protein
MLVLYLIYIYQIVKSISELSQKIMLPKFPNSYLLVTLFGDGLPFTIKHFPRSLAICLNGTNTHGE